MKDEGRPRITAILNCYGPEGGNISQLTIRADGAIAIFGEAAFAKAAVANVLRAALHGLTGEDETPTRPWRPHMDAEKDREVTELRTRAGLLARPELPR
jgi:hypothetical protein